MNVTLVIALLIFVAIFMVFIGMYRWLSNASEMQQRLMGVLPHVEDEVNRQMLAKKVNEQLSGYSFIAKLDHQLQAADISMSATEFLMIRVGATVGALVLGWILSGIIIGGLALAVIGWVVPGVMIKMQQSKRTRLFNEQLPDMLSLLVGSLRAGYGLLHACRIVNQEMPDPISKEFSRVLKETSLGYSLNDALSHLAERIESEDLELIVNAIAVQNETGGSLAEMLDTITTTIRDRIKLKGEIRVLTTQQRFTGYILTGLPFGTFALIMMLNPGYIMEIFTPQWMFIPAGALMMIFIGNIVMQKITKIEV
ncbi:MAG: type II secretion system F family protein [Caldilineaceae bacterium]